MGVIKKKAQPAQTQGEQRCGRDYGWPASTALPEMSVKGGGGGPEGNENHSDWRLGEAEPGGVVVASKRDQ